MIHRTLTIRSLDRRLALAAAVVCATLTTAHADVSGSYHGTLSNPARTFAVDVTLSQAGTGVIGSVTLDPSAPPLGGTYAVHGKATRTRLRLTGQNASGAKLIWRGAAGSGALNATVRLRGGGQFHGRLTATTGGGGNPANCDAVFTQNQAVFTDQVMGQVLGTSCVACHAAGGSAQAARLRVTPADPAATARSVARVVDPSVATNSLLLRKPLGQVSHGGGALLTAGSPQAQILEQWATLLVQSQCLSSGGGGGGGGGGDPFGTLCASCHGGTGAGTALAPDIRCTAPSQITDAVRRGRGGNAMPAFSTTALGAAELTAILAQLANSCSGTGADLFAANCASCHGPAGGGGQNANGVRGGNIRCSEAGELAGAIRAGGDGMPAFASLGNAAINRLATYVRGLCGPGGGGGGGGGDD